MPQLEQGHYLFNDVIKCRRLLSALPGGHQPSYRRHQPRHHTLVTFQSEKCNTTRGSDQPQDSQPNLSKRNHGPMVYLNSKMPQCHHCQGPKVAYAVRSKVKFLWHLGPCFTLWFHVRCGFVYRYRTEFQEVHFQGVLSTFLTLTSTTQVQLDLGYFECS